MSRQKLILKFSSSTVRKAAKEATYIGTVVLAAEIPDSLLLSSKELPGVTWHKLAKKLDGMPIYDDEDFKLSMIDALREELDRATKRIEELEQELACRDKSV